MFLSETIHLDIDNNEIMEKMIRVSGELTCVTCRKLYYDHPYIDNILDYQDDPFLQYICNGGIVKL